MNKKLIFDNIRHQLDRLSDKIRYHSWNRRITQRVSSNDTLSKEQIKSVKSFYKPFHNINIISHRYYTSKTGEFHIDYIPDSLWYAYIDPYYNPRNLAKAIDSKILYSRLLGGVKHPETIAFRINGFWLSHDFKPLNITEVLELSLSVKSVFIKQAEDSAGGHGVVFYDCTKGEENLFEILSKTAYNLVIQAGISQHEEMNRLNNSSVNTIRILSHITKQGEIKIRSVIVRMGRNGAHVDNASSGGITVGVNTDGRLKSVAYDVEGNKYYYHPDTKIKFSDIVIPNFEFLLSKIEVLHWQIPQFRLLSWDIAIDKTGQPILIEVNMHSGQLDFHQLNNGPVFGDDTQDILREVFGK